VAIYERRILVLEGKRKSGRPDDVKDFAEVHDASILD
jgi:hypothetical protein